MHALTARVVGLTVIGAMAVAMSAPSDAATKTKHAKKPARLTVKDTTGRPVHGEIWTKSGSGDAQYIGFCGTLAPHSARAGDYIVTIDSVSVDPNCPSVGTSGTITVKYTNYR